MPFCAECGRQLAENTEACPTCGRAVRRDFTPDISGSAAAPQVTSTDTAALTQVAPEVRHVESTEASSALPIPENLAGVAAYFFLIPSVVFLLFKPWNCNRFVRFHSLQNLFVAAASFVAWLFLVVLGKTMPLLVLPLWALAGLAGVALWLLLVIKAYQHEEFMLPYLGEVAAKYAGDF